MKRWIPTFVALLLPASLAAQVPTSVATYVAADDGVAGSPVLVGAMVGWESRYLGVRVGLGVDAQKLVESSEAAVNGTGRDGLVAAEMDAVLYLGDSRSSGVLPYAVAGVGLRAVSSGGSTGAAASWGAGGGVRTPLIGPLSLETEARYRQPLSEALEGPATRVDAGMEVRAGLSLRLGRRAAVAPAVAVPAAPRPLPRPVAVTGTRGRVAQGALAEAERHLGVPYLWGGNTPATGFDCSGFIRYVYRLQGIDLPRISQDQARAGSALPLDLGALEPGDLIAFASRGTVDHIAIYVGNGRIIHSSSSGGGVRYDDLNSRRGDWYRRHMVAARRVIPEGAQLGSREE